jgi:alginate O-acetyltransferase complex protein AlgI
LNFTDFSFWWLTLLVGGGLLAARGIARLLVIWRDRWDRVVLAGFSLTLFYNAAPGSFVIVLAEIAVNYGVLRWVVGGRRFARAACALAIAADLGVLIYFKYLDFLFGDLIAVLSLGITDSGRGSLANSTGGIPAGISFYTFQMVATIVDTYRKPRAMAALDYVNFIAFFPHLVAGPIQRRDELLPQLESFRFRFNSSSFDYGMRWIALGLFMKTVLADNLAPFIKAVDGTNPTEILSGAYLFGLRIYFDFAGYSFIALGIAAVLGVKLTVNFTAPYLARNVREFWSRWHVTLSNWFRDYLYKPLGGARVRFWVINVLVVFVVSGLWHGAGWNFILWGAYHGLLLIAYRLIASFDAPLGGPTRASARWQWGLPTGWLLVYPLAMFGWLFFMETNQSRLMAKLGALVNPGAWTAPGNYFLPAMNRVELAQLLLVLALAHAVLLLEHVAAWRDRNAVYAILTSRPVAAGMLMLTFLLQARAESPFIYFAF